MTARNFYLKLMILIFIVLSSSVFGEMGLKRYAIIVGANDGGEDRVILRYAVRDAKAFNKVMVDMGALDNEETMLLLNPDRFRIDQAFVNMQQKILSDSPVSRKELVFYYSGHSDEEGIMLQNETYSYKELRDKIASMDTDVRIAILDSCASGAFTRTKGGVRKPPFQIDESVQMKGYAFLTSSSETEAAQESDKIQASFFTYYLVSGLRGAADTTEDGMVTLNEAYSYAYKETLEKTQKTQYGPQHPGYDIQLTGTGDLVLTDLRTTNSLLVLNEEFKGRFYIRDTSGNLIAEVNKAAGRNLEIGLSPDYYQILWDDNGVLREARINLIQDASVKLKASQFQAIETQPTIARGDNDESKPLVPDDKEEAIDDFFETIFDGEEAEDSDDKIFDNNVFDDPFFKDSQGEEPALDEDLEWDTEETAYVEPFFSFLQPEELEADQIRYLPVEVTLLPSLGSESFLKWNNSSNLSLNLTAGAGYSVEGIQLSLFLNFLIKELDGVQICAFVNAVLGNTDGAQMSSLANLSVGNLDGAQASGLVNFALENVSGVQAAGIGNLSGKSLDGFQAAGVANAVLGELNGFQASGLANLSLGMATGFQAAGLGNFAGQGMDGFQASGVVNIALGPFAGLQVAGITNITGTMTGLQVSGIFNCADDLDGAQIGIVNRGKNIAGIQLGLINISDSYEIGFPIGLINIVRDGIFTIDWWTSQRNVNHVSLRVGSENFYTLFTGSASWENEVTSWSYGMGYGVNLPFAIFFVSADACMNVLYPQGADWFQFSPENLMPTARTLAGIDLGWLGAFCGFKYDFHVPGLYNDYPDSYNVTVLNEFIFGIQLSLNN
ncbi:MAG: caspase family protein [Spirochaetales bacterium]|nr:caspase family protein [Spirochaetales bacterium]